MVNFAAVSELREAMERGETVYRVGIETLTRAQVERRIEIVSFHGNESEASRLYAMLHYPIEGAGIGHGYFCGCMTCVDARARFWRAR
jgi:hypothetical protein